MGPTVNPFNVFSVSEISQAIQVLPNQWGRVTSLGIFQEKPVTSPQIAVEQWYGSLGLVPSSNFRGPGNVGKVNKRKLNTFSVPKFVQDEFCGPEEVQGIRQFAGNEQDNLARLLNEKLAACKAKLQLTQEHLFIRALQGIILDADASTVIYNLFTEFGVSQLQQDFLLGTATTDVRGACVNVVRHIEDGLLGETMDHVHALCSPEFFSKLIKHPNVQVAYQYYQEAAQRLGGDVRKGFIFGGITFEEYRGYVTGTGGAVRFIPANACTIFPVGTTNTFKNFLAPADFNETVNTYGQQFYAKTAPGKFDRGWEIHTQMNMLPMCARPTLLVSGITSN